MVLQGGATDPPENLGVRLQQGQAAIDGSGQTSFWLTSKVPPQVPRDLLKHLVSEFCLQGRAPSAHWVAVHAELFLCTLHSLGSSLHPHPQPTTHVIPAGPHGISAAVLCTTSFQR